MDKTKWVVNIKTDFGVEDKDCDLTDEKVYLESEQFFNSFEDAKLFFKSKLKEFSSDTFLSYKEEGSIYFFINNAFENDNRIDKYLLLISKFINGENIIDYDSDEIITGDLLRIDFKLKPKTLEIKSHHKEIVGFLPKLYLNAFEMDNPNKQYTFYVEGSMGIGYLRIRLKKVSV